eukprot:362653-Chlamydomonas_euryale.AAC.1
MIAHGQPHALQEGHSRPLVAAKGHAGGSKRSCWRQQGYATGTLTMSHPHEPGDTRVSQVTPTATRSHPLQPGHTRCSQATPTAGWSYPLQSVLDRCGWAPPKPAGPSPARMRRGEEMRWRKLSAAHGAHGPQRMGRSAWRARPRRMGRSAWRARAAAHGAHGARCMGCMGCGPCGTPCAVHGAWGAWAGQHGHRLGWHHANAPPPRQGCTNRAVPQQHVLISAEVRLSRC